MAYLAPYFEADAFVSYSHGDPLGQGDAPLKQWTFTLIQKLEREIRSIDPEFAHVILWRDEHVDPTMHLTPALRGKVSASCILLIVMSRYYLASSWCKDELDWFARQIRDRSLDQGRVFILRAQPTDASKWPEFLRDERGHAMPGFQFCAAEAEIPYGWPDFIDQNEEFRKELSRLLTALVRRLREFKKRLPGCTAAPATLLSAPAQNPSRVYLHTNREFLSARDTIKLALEQDGLTPVTQSAAASGVADFGQDERRSRLKMLKRCDALALVTGDGGEQDEDEFFTVCVDERKEIEAAHGGQMPCVVLDRSSGRLSFVPTDWGAAYIDTTHDNWRGEMRQWFARATAQAAGLLA
jgi:hypothetical protein